MRILLSLVLALALVLPFPAWAFDWSRVVERLSKSVVALSAKTHGVNSYPVHCAGFVVQPELVLSADHCYAENLRVDGLVAIELGHGLESDLTLLRVIGLRKEPVTFSTTPIAVGKEIMAYGHAYGATQPILRAGNVAAHDTKHYYTIIFDKTYIGGMSGAPVVNTSGDVVGIVQMRNTDVGIGVDAEAILWFINAVQSNSN